MSKLHHVERGKGMPVVLVHGFPLDLRIWESQVGALSDRYRVIAVDMEGFGKSQGAGDFSIDSLAEGIREHLKSIGALPCVLGGLSMGGYVALAYAQKCPTDLLGLMLIDTKASADNAEQKEGRAKMIQLVKEKGSKGVAEAMMPKMLAKAAIDAGAPVVGRLREIMEACAPATIERALVAMRERVDRTEMLASIPVPTLIVVGEQDAITPVEGAKKMHEAIAKSRLAVIGGAGHMSPMERPDDVNRVMQEFLRGCEERTAA